MIVYIFHFYSLYPCYLVRLKLMIDKGQMFAALVDGIIRNLHVMHNLAQRHQQLYKAIILIGLTCRLVRL